MPRKVWTTKEKKALIRLYPNTLNDILAVKFNATITQIYHQAFSLNIHKSIKYLNKYGCRIQKGSQIGKLTQYKKGATPFNKGKKQIEYMSKEGIKKVAKTQFSKGNKPHNTKKNGFISIRTDKRTGYITLYIRIKLCKWIPYHRYLWEKKHGPVPKNHVIIFKDGNTLNCKLSNLKCITKQENMIRNSISKYPIDLQKAILLRNKLNNKLYDLSKNI